MKLLDTKLQFFKRLRNDQNRGYEKAKEKIRVRNDQKLPVGLKYAMEKFWSNGCNGKESMQWKYIICLLMNKRTMNDFKVSFWYSFILKKVRSTGIKLK